MKRSVWPERNRVRAKRRLQRDEHLYLRPWRGNCRLAARVEKKRDSRIDREMRREAVFRAGCHLRRLYEAYGLLASEEP